jgi:hypothetical protein
MASAKEIYGRYKDFLDKMELHYSEAEEDNIIRITMPLDGKLQKTNMMISCRDDYVSTRAFSPLNADEPVRQNVAEFLARANYGMSYGHFEMDLRDGEVSFKLVLDCEERTSLSDDLLKKIFIIPKVTLDRYGDGLLAVMFGMKSPEEAVHDVEGEDHSSCDHDE